MWGNVGGWGLEQGSVDGGSASHAFRHMFGSFTVGCRIWETTASGTKGWC